MYQVATDGVKNGADIPDLGQAQSVTRGDIDDGVVVGTITFGHCDDNGT
jgi:hypothetical protein